MGKRTNVPSKQNGMKIKHRRERDYRKRQKSTSVYFLLWTVFSALCFVIVCLFAVMQRIVMEHTYKSEAANEKADKKHRILQAVFPRIHKKSDPESNFRITFFRNRSGVGIRRPEVQLITNFRYMFLKNRSSSSMCRLMA